MQGKIKTHIDQKQYGFICGEDGKDYFFHYSSLRDKGQTALVADGAAVQFEPKATPKGYQATSLTILAQTTTYTVPDAVLTSKTEGFREWEIMEKGKWIVHGSCRNSPDSAKNKLMEGARRIGANGVICVEYYKTTGSEAGTGSGTHRFTIHNYRGRPVTLARKDVGGRRSADDFCRLDQRAAALKRELVKQTEASRRVAAMVWGTIATIAVIVLLVKSTWDLFTIVPVLIISLLLGCLFGRVTNEDAWLHEG